MEKRERNFLILLFVGAVAIIWMATMPENVGFAPGDYDCEKYYGTTLYYRANNNEVLYDVSHGWNDPQILCYNNLWWEAKPTSNWDFAIDTDLCTQKGSWYLDSNAADGVWKQGTLPSGCQPPPPPPGVLTLTCTDVDFDCDGIVNQDIDFEYLNDTRLTFPLQRAINQTWINTLYSVDENDCRKLGDFFKKILDIGQTVFRDTELNIAINKLVECHTPTLVDVGLVAHYRFEGDVDDRISGFDGEVSGAKYATGKFGKALKFDGSNDYAKVTGFNAIADSDFTIAFWAQPGFDAADVDDDEAEVFFALDGTKDALIYVNDANIAFAIGDKTNILTSTFLDDSSYDSVDFSSGDWLHIVAVYDKSADSVQLYVDGNDAGDGNGEGNDGVGAGDLYLGGMTSLYYKGLIDDLRIYNEALDEEDIENLFEHEEAELMIYLTDSRWKGDFKSGTGSFTPTGTDGVDRADYICTHDTNKPADSENFKALIGVTGYREVGENDWVLEDETIYVNDEGNIIGETDEDGWFEFPFEDFVSTRTYKVATGLDADGAVDDNCDEWSVGSDDEQLIWGYANRKDVTLIYNDNEDCDEEFRIYCVEQLSPIGPLDCFPNWNCTAWSNKTGQCGAKTCTELNKCDPKNLSRTETKTCGGATPTPVCGDEICDVKEDEISCPEDCVEEPECETDADCDEGYECKTGECKLKKVSDNDRKMIYIIIAVVLFLLVALILFLIYKTIKKRNRPGGVSLGSSLMKKPPMPPRMPPTSNQPSMLMKPPVTLSYGR